MEDRIKECRQVLFRVDVDLMEQPSNKFKINKNAQQLHANGVFIMIDKRSAPHLNNLVLVEGGPKVIKKYKKLMLRRIKWVSSTQNTLKTLYSVKLFCQAFCEIGKHFQNACRNASQNTWCLRTVYTVPS